MLPAVIEYLSSVDRPGGGRLCKSGKVQWAMTLPGQMQVTFSIAPPIHAYAAIKYGMSYTCLPNTFYIEVSQLGEMYIQATLDVDWMREIIPFYVLYTQAEPVNMLARNTTNLMQRASGTQYFLIIDTEDDMALVKQHLEEFSSVETNRILQRIEELLTKITVFPPIKLGVK